MMVFLGFIIGVFIGIALMCIVQVNNDNSKDKQIKELEDELEMSNFIKGIRNYKEVIIKIQELKAYYDYEIEDFKRDKMIYYTMYSKEGYIRLLQRFSNSLDLLLVTEETAINELED